MGLIVIIYRGPASESDQLNAFKDAREITVVNVDGPFEPAPERPAALLLANTRGTVRVVPAVQVAGRWQPIDRLWTAGGTYAATSDSRWTAAVELLTGARFYGAVAIHDMKHWNDTRD